MKLLLDPIQIQNLSIIVLRSNDGKKSLRNVFYVSYSSVYYCFS